MSEAESKHYEYSFSGEQMRLDTFLSHIEELNISRSYAQDLIKQEKVVLNGKKAKASHKLKEGELVSIDLPEPEELKVEAEDIPLNIVYEDDEFLVIDKPINMVTHPAPGNYSGTLVNALMHYCKDKLSAINGVLRPGIVHRLDKDTSGLIVVAKTDNAHNHIAKQIQDRSLERRYLAIVHDNIKADKGVIDTPIMRHPKYRYKMSTLSNMAESMSAIEKGLAKRAKTNWYIKDRFSLGAGSERKNYCFVECKLDTGRTHQIRVHLSSVHHPIVGDDLYGAARFKNPFKASRPMLHSYKLSLEHPISGDVLSFHSDLPVDFMDILERLEDDSERS